MRLALVSIFLFPLVALGQFTPEAWEVSYTNIYGRNDAHVQVKLSEAYSSTVERAIGGYGTNNLAFNPTNIVRFGATAYLNYFKKHLRNNLSSNYWVRTDEKVSGKYDSWLSTNYAGSTELPRETATTLLSKCGLPSDWFDVTTRWGANTDYTNGWASFTNVIANWPAGVAIDDSWISFIFTDTTNGFVYVGDTIERIKSGTNWTEFASSCITNYTTRTFGSYSAQNGDNYYASIQSSTVKFVPPPELDAIITNAQWYGVPTWGNATYFNKHGLSIPDYNTAGLIFQTNAVFETVWPPNNSCSDLDGLNFVDDDTPRGFWLDDFVQDVIYYECDFDY